ncbi:MAG: hypothetical protein E6Q66_07040 [Pedobacter sp.]|nr:MAG: hypothetical protein E6Q66_07040 [Pedobacter sp.]
MKIILKVFLCAPLLYLLGTGCNKPDLSPEPTPTTFTVQSNSFTNGIVAEQPSPLLGGMESPQLSFRNVPAGTQQIVAVLEDNTKHVYWSAVLSGNVTDLTQTQSGTPPQYHHSDVMTIITPFSVPRARNGSTACKLTAFALRIPITHDEMIIISHPEQRMTRANYLQLFSASNNNRILGLAESVYPIKTAQSPTGGCTGFPFSKKIDKLSQK